jgi:predicted Rossmann fold flavoprotein
VQKNNHSIIVVGAGPAGMMAAIRASQLRQKVTLIDKSDMPGHKLLLSGKGRCNLTNTCPFDEFMAHFSNGAFLRDAFKKFFNQDLMAFFEKRGLKLKVERQLRVFPANDRSASVRDVLMHELVSQGVTLLQKTAVKDIAVANGAVKAVKLQNGETLPVERLILATGGVSYAFTGSTGDGIRFAQALGHRVIALRPGLVPLIIKKDFVFPQGLTLKNISLEFSSAGESIASDTGEIMFTHFGISGPLVFSCSGHVADWLHAKRPVTAAIDFKPGLSHELLDQRLLRDFKREAKKNIRTVLKGLLPLRMVDIFIARLGAKPDIKCNQVPAQLRQRIRDMLKGFSMVVTGSLPIEEAMVTRGGVSLRDIDPRTMGSRIVKGLYFAGEMIDVDADTGGFNLQAAFSTGYLAGESAALEP